MIQYFSRWVVLKVSCFFLDFLGKVYIDSQKFKWSVMILTGRLLHIEELVIHPTVNVSTCRPVL